jgi:hypothetical protein
MESVIRGRSRRYAVRTQLMQLPYVVDGHGKELYNED